MLPPPLVELPGWPIDKPRYYMGHHGPLLIVCLGPELTSDDFVQHVAELTRAIDVRSPDFKLGVFYHSEASTAYSLDNVRLLGNALSTRKQQLRDTTAGFVMCTSSVLNRTAMRILGSLAPPPYPQTVVKTLTHGYDYLARVVHGVDRALFVQWHADLARRYGLTFTV